MRTSSRAVFNGSVVQAGRARMTAAVVAAAVTASAGAAFGQASLVTLLIGEGTTMPNGQLIANVQNPVVNGLGGWAIRTRTGNPNATDPSQYYDYVYGRTTSAAAAGIIGSEGPVGSTGESVEGINGVRLTDAPVLALSATVGLVTPRPAAAFVGNSLVARSAGAIPSGLGLDGLFYGRSVSLVNATTSGDAMFLSTITTSTSLPSNETRVGLFRRTAGGTTSLLLQNGAVIAGAGTVSPSKTGAIGTVRASRDGSQWATVIDTNPSNFNLTESIVVNGALARLASGTAITVGNTPTWVDGPAGTGPISSFGQLDIQNSGSVAFQAYYSASSSYAVVVDGRTRYIGGMNVAGRTLTGIVNNVVRNAAGDVLYSYSSTGLFLNEQFISQATTGGAVPVDTDNDGQADSGVTLDRFMEVRGVALTERDATGNVDVYFVGQLAGSSGTNRLFRTTYNALGSRHSGAASGSWGTSALWSSGVPDAIGARAAFSNAAGTAPSSVTVDGTRTVGVVTFDRPGQQTVTGGTLALNNFGAAARIEVRSGSHTVASALAPAGALSLDVLSASSTLTLTGSLSSAAALYKTGPGRVSVPSVSVDSLAIDGGTLALSGARPAVSVVSRLNVASGATLDLGLSDLIVRNGDVAGLRVAVAAWYAGGAKNGTGIAGNASAFRTVAVFPNTDGSGNAYFNAFDGVAVSAADVILMPTYVGDTNLDGRVDGNDVANFVEALSVGGLTGWSNGDVNYDGLINGADWSLISAALGAGLPPLTGGGGSSIPEPGALGLIAGAAMLTLRRRRA